MVKLIRSGVTTVLVSHDLQVIEEISNKALRLDHGGIAAEGEPKGVISKYKGEIISPA